MSEFDTSIGDYLTQLFLDLGRIDSPSKGEKEMAKAIASKLDAYNINHHTDELFNVFARIEGSGDPILLCAHLDAVEPCIGKDPQFDGEEFYTNAKTILGADDLVGVCSIFGLLENLKENSDHRTIEILFTTQEEIGGPGVKHFLSNNELQSKDVLILDSLQPVGGIILSSPSKHNFFLKVFGRSQHGSQNNALATSAISKIAEIIHEWPIGQIDDQTMLNLGTINGGNAVNTVPGEATLEGSIKIEAVGELRVNDEKMENDVLTNLRTVIDTVDAKYPTVDTVFECTEVRKGYAHSEDNALIEEIKNAFKEIRIDPFTKHSRGVSDANTFNAFGYNGILLGTGVENAHTVNERVRLSEIVNLTKFLIEFVRE